MKAHISLWDHSGHDREMSRDESRCRAKGTDVLGGHNPALDLRITSVFPCVAREFEGRASFRLPVVAAAGW
jgi:hypothetical protein